MKCYRNRIITKIREPGNHIFYNLYIHHRRAFFRTPAVFTIRRASKGGDDHDMKRGFHQGITTGYTFILIHKLDVHHLT